MKKIIFQDFQTIHIKTYTNFGTFAILVEPAYGTFIHWRINQFTFSRQNRRFRQFTLYSFLLGLLHGRRRLSVHSEMMLINSFHMKCSNVIILVIFAQCIFRQYDKNIKNPTMATITMSGIHR